jgi:N-acetylmuramic acid 6-phosphate etherase
MLDKLLTEQSNAASEDIDARSTGEILRIINNEDRKVADAITPEIPNIAKAVDAIAERIRQGGRLFYIGAGTSGRLGVLDAAECPPTFNVSRDLVQAVIAGGEKAVAQASEVSEDDPESGGRDVTNRGLTSKDVLVGIAASGSTPYVLGAIAEARKIGAETIGISCTQDSDLARLVNIPITPLPGPEIITGSTRMKAGTATKLVLNMLSTGAMIRLGHVFGNLMVNVQPTNSKLSDRARRIIAQAGRVEIERAAQLLEASGGRVKTAIVMARLGVNREEAERLLNVCGGRVSEALNHG